MPQAARKTSPVEPPADDSVETPPPMPARQVVAELRALVARENYETIAAGVGCHEGTLNKLLAGKTPWSDALLAKASAFLRLEAIRAADAAAGLDGRLVATSVSKSIADVATVAQVQQGLGLVVGESGVGKTCALQLFARHNPAALYVHASARVNAPSRMLDELWSLAGFRFSGPPRPSRAKLADETRRKHSGVRARATRRPKHGAPTFKQRYDQIVEAWAVPEGATTGRIILIDDAHVLTYPTFELLRSIHDDSRVAILFAATGRFREISEFRQAGQMFEQLMGRICIRRTIRRPPVTDVERVARVWMPAGAKLSPDARQYLSDLASGLAGLRLVKHHVRLAYRLGRFGAAKGQPLDRSHLAHAHKLLADAE